MELTFIVKDTKKTDHANKVTIDTTQKGISGLRICSYNSLNISAFFCHEFPKLRTETIQKDTKTLGYIHLYPISIKRWT